MSGEPGSMSRVFRDVTACRIDIPDGRVAVEGADGTDASLDIRGLDGSADGGGVVAERSEDGTLTIRLADPGPARLRWLRAERRPRPEIHLRWPRGASVRGATVGGEIRIRGCQGTQEATTVAGDATIDHAEGSLAVRTVSGSIAVSGGALATQTATTSGRVRVEARVLESLHVRSVSGRVAVAGRLMVGRDHRIETLSGDVRITSDGLRLDARTISGHLVAEGEARRSTRGATTQLVVGDGAAELHVTTVSGDVHLASGGTRSTGPDPVLEALEALARGDISVEEADRRLEVLHG